MISAATCVGAGTKTGNNPAHFAASAAAISTATLASGRQIPESLS
jgi:hypothetical protein